jgi:hypothetical protein
MQDKSELQAVYRIPELATVANTSRYLMERLLREAGVRRIRVGTTAVIIMREIQEKTPLLWEGLQAFRDARRAAQQAPKPRQKIPRRASTGERL